MTGKASSQWLQVSTRCTADASEAVAALMLEIAPAGVSIEPVGEHWLVSVYLPQEADTKRAVESIRVAVAGVDPSLTSGQVLGVETRWLHEDNWAQAWKRHYRSERIGRLVIKPTWEAWPPTDESLTPRADDLLIELDPGMAFGTGQHATTRLCLRALERLVRPGQRVADIGCGSGILSIAAARLGAAEVLAVDTDPLAVAITRGNLRQNAVADRVRVVREAGFPADADLFDLIVANISAPAVSLLVERSPGRLAPGGVCVLSGFTDAGVAEVRAAIARAGFCEFSLEREGDWLALTAGRGELA